MGGGGISKMSIKPSFKSYLDFTLSSKCVESAGESFIKHERRLAFPDESGVFFFTIMEEKYK